MKLISVSFEHGGRIPAVYTCVGEDRPVPLRWYGVPSGTRSFVLICDDPDAPMGTWDHWILYNIPADVTEVKEGAPPWCKTGINSWGRGGYGGPCPPDGEHRYFFKLYALDTAALSFAKPPSKSEVMVAMEGHVLASAELMGLFTK